MAEEVKIEPVDMTPVAAEMPPKANPLAKPTVTATLKPGLRLPPKPGATVGALRPGLKLPPKPGATVTALKPGLKLPPKPGATVSALRPGLKLPTKPVIRKPGSTVAAKPLPKPVVPVAAKSEAAPAATPAAPVQNEAVKPVPVDMQGVAKLPTVDARPISREEAAAPVVSANPKPLEQLKSVTGKLKGLTQQIPQQAILHKTGIVADGSSEIQKEAAKHKTARISLSEAIGVAPVKNEAVPMKTIRIKRPIDISNATKPLAPLVKPVSAATEAAAPAPDQGVEADAPAPDSAPSNATITQRKTLKITRPGGAVRPSGKFGLKRSTAPSSTSAQTATVSQATTVVNAPGDGNSAVADIPDIPPMPLPNIPAASAASDGPAWLWSLSSLVQAAACVAIGALAYFLYENVNTLYF